MLKTSHYNQIICLDSAVFAEWCIMNHTGDIRELAVVAHDTHAYELAGIPCRYYDGWQDIPIHPHWRYLVLGDNPWTEANVDTLKVDNE